MPSRREPAHVAQLGDHQYRREGADPAQLAEQPDPRIRVRVAADRQAQRGDLRRQQAHDTQHALDMLGRLGSQTQIHDGLVAVWAKHRGWSGDHALAGQHRVHPVAKRRTQPDQKHPLPDQVPRVTLRTRCDIRLRQQAAS